jgi:hypothetical protein
MLSRRVIGLGIVGALAIPVAGYAQAGETDVTRRETMNVMRVCGIPGGWIKVTMGDRGRLRAERSPSLTPAQDRCVDAAIGLSAAPVNGDGQVR